MRKGTPLALAAAVILLAGCSDMSSSQQRTLSGAGVGAAAGTVVGALSGATLWGAAIGAGAGAVGGFIWDQHKQGEARAYQAGVASGQRSATPATPPAAGTAPN